VKPTKGVDAVEILARCEVFLGLDDSDLQKIAVLPSCRLEVYEAGETISQQGEVAQKLYVLDEGKVSLVVNLFPQIAQPARQVVIDTVTTGGIFDWSALVPPHILTRSVVCVEQARVLAINGAELLQLMEHEPHIGYEVMSGLTRVIGWRLREVQKLFAGIKGELIHQRRNKGLVG